MVSDSSVSEEIEIFETFVVMVEIGWVNLS
jgi:hypothetical protein